jgi:crotonobetainyl-CoA:carnitine CoA-transferase CaiB-like acyl-CoA transferase
VTPGPLKGIRVFDLTLWMVGPWAGSQLGALGADVLHVEKPGTPPEALGRVPPTIHGTSIGYIAWNMNKRGLGLDLKDPEHVRTALDVVAQCDVFLSNMRPGVVDRLGLGYEAVAERNPAIVYCDVNGWGHVGPMSGSPGSDGVLQGYSGFWSLNGTGGEFYRHYTQLDSSTGNLAVVGILAALAHRRRTGVGQRVRVSMLRAAMALQAVPLGLTLAGERLAAKGAASQLTAPDDVFTCADGLHLGVSVTSEEQWAALCGEVDGLDRPEWRTNDGRLADPVLGEALRTAFAARSRPYWLWRLRKAGVPVGYPLTFDELRSHRQVDRLGQLSTVDTHHWGQVTTGGSPWRFSGHDTHWSAPPLAGEHTAEILKELGI